MNELLSEIRFAWRIGGPMPYLMSAILVIVLLLVWALAATAPGVLIVLGILAGIVVVTRLFLGLFLDRDDD